MRKQSAMYQLSGGMNRHHTCRECCNLIQQERGKKRIYKCRAYGITEGHDTDWPAHVMACRFFGTDGPNVPLINQQPKKQKKAELRVRDGVVGQYCVYDYPDVLPEQERG